MPRQLIRLATVLLALALLGACSYEESSTQPPPVDLPTVPEVIVITVAGSADVEGTSINACDDSTSSPAGEIVAVRWRLRRGSATEVGTANAAAGDCISIGPGLAPGTYALDQEVTASDGSARQRTYSNLVVADPAADDGGGEG